MKALTGCFAAAVLAQSVLAATETVRWFDETYSGFREVRPDKWTTSAGTWRKDSESDRSRYSSADNRLHVDSAETECRFVAATTPTANADVRIFVKAALTAYCDGDEVDALADIPFAKLPQASIALRRRTDGTLCFVGLVTTRIYSYEDGATAGDVPASWVELSAEDLEPRENVEYEIGMERDYSCVPTRVRYTVDGKVLRDRFGNAWFSSRSPLGPEVAQDKKPSADNLPTSKNTSASTVSFCGRGTVGEIRADVTFRAPPRATVSFAPVARPRAGEFALTPSVAPNAGVTPGATVTYDWYLTDAAGMRVEGGSRGAGESYRPTSADYCHWVTVDVADENGYLGTGRFWFSDLPVVYLDVDDGTEGAVVWPSSKKEKHKGRIRIVGNAEYKDQIADPMDMTINVRGNSTSRQDKKPYKIKLDKKTDVFGLGGGVKSKHWVLLANVFDESLVRNKIAYDLSGQFGTPVWMKSEWCDVVMNGQYVGNYLFCQQIRIAEERVNIFEWDTGKVAEQAVDASPWLAADKDAEDNIDAMLEENCAWMTSGEFSYGGSNYVLTATKEDHGIGKKGKVQVYWKGWKTCKKGKDVSGGYLFELDYKKMPGSSAPMASTFIQEHSYLHFDLAVNTPEFAFTNGTVSNEIWNMWFDLGDAWAGAGGRNRKGQHYTELADFDSMVSYFLSMYVPGCDDAASLSRYAYRDLGGKMVFGPAWDFDFGVGSLQIRERSPWTLDEYGQRHYAEIEPERWIPKSGVKNFMGRWTTDPYFTFRARERYWATRAYMDGIVRDGGLIDRYKAKLGNSARANDLRWNNRIGFWGNAQERGDIEVVREFLARRFAWLDGQFATVGNAVVDASATTPHTSLRYARNDALRPVFDAATARAGSVETEIVDAVREVRNAPVTATVAVPGGATRLVVAVNGLEKGTFDVASGSAAVSIAAADLRTGAEGNLVAFTATDGTGAVKARNVAVLTCTLPAKIDETDEPEAKGVTIEWLDAAREAILAADPEAEIARPNTYADYVAFAKGASPVGKSVGGAEVPLVYDWVAGTDPSDRDDVFSAGIAMDANGLPVITWTPETCPYGPRSYLLWGAPDLNGPWASTDATAPADGFREANRFFRVEVDVAPAK